MKTPDHIKDLKPDPRNARKHNPRNIGMVEESLQEVGAARSIVIDENNVVLAGNGVIEAAGNAGITKLKVVDADGSTIIAVRRTGLTAKQKTRLALLDNRAAELAEWDAEVLAQLKADDPDVLKGQFLEEEIAKLLDKAGELVDLSAEGEAPEASKTHCPKCGFIFEVPK
jgi:ParB-like chromosome segregation protein Spo0J